MRPLYTSKQHRKERGSEYEDGLCVLFERMLVCYKAAVCVPVNCKDTTDTYTEGVATLKSRSKIQNSSEQKSHELD